MKKHAVRVVLIIAAVAAVSGVVLTLVNRANKAGQALPIETYTVKRGVLVEHITGTGTFKPLLDATVTARVAGQVASIAVEEGTRRTAGGPLLQLDSSDYRLAVDQARSALETARRTVRLSIVTLRASYRSAATAYDQAARTSTKNRELFAGKAISGDELKASEDARATASVALQSAREQLNLRLSRPLAAEPLLESASDGPIVESSPEVVQASLSLRAALDNLDRCTVRSPIGGTVTSVLPRVGDLVQVNGPLVKVEDLSTMIAEVQIDEVDIDKLAVGNSAEITSDSLIGRTLKGRVLSIAPTITTMGSTRVSTVKISLDPTATTLRSGASCSVKITTRTKEDVVNIPITGFVTRGGRERVFVLLPLEGRDRSPAIYRLEERTITTGISTINSVEVASGLRAGEIIANGAMNRLRTGMLVTPKERL